MTVLFCFVSKQLLLQSLSDMQGNTDLPHVALLRNPPLPASDIINGYDSRDGTQRKRAECISKFMVIVWRAERSADVTGLRLLDERRSLEGLWNISSSSFLSMHCSTCLMEIILFEIVSSENRKRLLSVRLRLQPLLNRRFLSHLFVSLLEALCSLTVQIKGVLLFNSIH